jgi:acyl-[acyl-carrier-protein]-phospholipid O-acyltransferase/long-chain-fatty-acid--[acyl-carrier-protein] ligase
MSSPQFSLLTTRRFFPLFLTQFWGAFNDNAFKSTMAVLITYKLVADISHAQLLVNLGGGVFILPFFLLSTLAGELSDKYDRARLIRIVKSLEILFMALGMLGFYLGNVPLLMVTLFLMGVHSTFFGPIKYSALPDLLYPQELLAGNGLVEGSTFIAILIGTIVGTQLGATTAGAILASGICIVVAVIGWISSLFVPRVPLGDPGLRINPNIFTAIWRLVRFTRQNRPVYLAILAISWFWFMGVIYITQFPVYTRAIIGGDEHVVTLFLVMFSVGIAVGSLLCNHFLRGAVHGRYVPACMLAMTVFTLDLCWASHGHAPALLLQGGGVVALLSGFTGWRITLDLFLLSVAGGFYIVPLYALMQVKSEAAHRSRIVSCNNIIGALFMFVAALMAMALTAIGFSSVQLFLVIGVANAVVVFFAWKKLAQMV